MRPLDVLRYVFIKALREIPDGDCIKSLADEWNEEIEYLRKHYDFTYKKDSEGENE